MVNELKKVDKNWIFIKTTNKLIKKSQYSYASSALSTLTFLRSDTFHLSTLKTL